VAEIFLSGAPGAASHGTPPCVPLQEHQLHQALRLSQALGWPYRLDDWQDALRLGHGIGVELEGELRATALWWPWGERFATCGMIIVDAALQGRGIGRALVGDLLDAAGSRTMLLRSTVAGRRLYEQLGFAAFGRVHQHQATLAAPCLEGTAANTRAMQPGDAAGLLELDRAASGMDRSRLLDALGAAGQFIVAGPQGRPTGYACVRRWGRGVVIGPVVAGDDAEARELVAAALLRHPGEFVRIDVTEDSGLSPWLEALGLPCVDRVTSMARGAFRGCAARASVFALASQSLG
jgi:GNAT superfamily N-acetyltransferase